MVQWIQTGGKYYRRREEQMLEGSGHWESKDLQWLISQIGSVLHTFSLSTGDTEAGRALSLRPAWLTRSNSRPARTTNWGYNTKAYMKSIDPYLLLHPEWSNGCTFLAWQEGLFLEMLSEVRLAIFWKIRLWQWGRWGSLGEITGIKGGITGMKGRISGMKVGVTGLKGRVTGMKGSIKRSNRKKMWVISILILFIGLVPSTYQQASMPQQDVRGLLRLEKSITKAYVCWYGRMLRAYRGQLVRPHKKFPGESWCLIPGVQKSKNAVSKLKGRYRGKKMTWGAVRGERKPLESLWRNDGRFAFNI